MKNEDENRVKTNVDNSANENGAHGRACVSLTADKSIQSDSQLDKYGSDKINGNIRGSVSDCVAACTKEVQKRCLKEKKNAIRHTEKKSSREVELPRIFSARSRFFCPSAMAARGAPPPLANPAKAEMIVIIGNVTPTPVSAREPTSGIRPIINAVYNVI